MFNTAKPARDAFTFSLGGLTTIASVVAAPAVANDRINQSWDERFELIQNQRLTPVWDDCDHRCCPQPA